MDTNNTAEETALTNEEKKENFEFIKKINPKVLGIILTVLILGGLGYYYKSILVAATVDGHIINRWTIIKKLEKQNGKSVLDALIDDQLINNAASKQNISIGEGDLNKKLDEIKSQIEGSGSTLEVALSTANMTMDELKKQIVLQLKLEKLLGDKLNVSDEELNKYITDNKVEIPAGEEATTKNQIRDQIKSQKFNSEISSFLTELRNSAKVHTFVNY